ncbi:hypothetical protein R6Q59_035757 [Mikania micrantha]
MGIIHLSNHHQGTIMVGIKDHRLTSRGHQIKPVMTIMVGRAAIWGHHLHNHHPCILMLQVLPWAHLPTIMDRLKAQIMGRRPLPIHRPHHRDMVKVTENRGMTIRVLVNIHMEVKGINRQLTLKVGPPLIQGTGRQISMVNRQHTTCRHNRVRMVNLMVSHHDNNPTLHPVGQCSQVTLSIVLLLMMGIVDQLLVVMAHKVVNQFLGMVSLVDSSKLLVFMLRPHLVVVMVHTPLRNLDTMNKQLQAVQVTVTKEQQIRRMVVVQGWQVMVHHHQFSLLILKQLLPQLQFSLVMTNLPHKQVVM